MYAMCHVYVYCLYIYINIKYVYMCLYVVYRLEKDGRYTVLSLKEKAIMLRTNFLKQRLIAYQSVGRLLKKFNILRG